MAGPSPAPRLYMLVNNGSIVQEQTAKIPPEMAAIVQDNPFLGVCPEVFEYRSLADEYSNDSCDEECGEQAQHHVFLRVPFGKVERGINGGHEPLIARAA